MVLKNYFLISLAQISRFMGRGKYFRKKLFCSQRIMEKNFHKQSRFSFVQVGANDGVSFDFLYNFVINRKSKGIVIEPIKEYYKELCENYKNQPNILKINKAINKVAGNVKLYKVDSSKIELYPDWVKGIASFNLNHLTKFEFIKKEHILEERVKAEPLMNIINKCNLSGFDYFQVDTEGYDYEVVDMFDFEKYKPKMVKAEYVNLSMEEKKKIKTKLRSNRYYVFFQGLDIVGIDMKRIKL
jgi:FkbM family methyltransferase